MTPQLLSLATAVPPFALPTGTVLDAAEPVFKAGRNDFERLKPLFANTGIECRYAVQPLPWFATAAGWPERGAAYVEGAMELFRSAAAQALENAGVHAAAVDAIVTVSSTGIATPSIEARVLHQMGFRDETRRIPVFGLGCAGGVTGLALAADIARARPGQIVLMVALELCTLAFRADDMSTANVVATALFGDGAAAAVLCTKGSGLAAFEYAGEHCWPDSLDIMGWRIDPQGLGAIFSRSIPDLVGQDLRPVTERFLAARGLSLASIDHFTFHPGGAKVVTALEQAFELGQGRLADEREVLRGFGNMSAPTVLFVLQRALRKCAAGRRLLAALGPGFTASFLTMLH